MESLKQQQRVARNSQMMQNGGGHVCGMWESPWQHSSSSFLAMMTMTDMQRSWESELSAVANVVRQ